MEQSDQGLHGLLFDLHLLLSLLCGKTSMYLKVIRTNFEENCQKIKENYGNDSIPIFNQKRIKHILTLKATNTTIAEFENTADPDEMAHNGPSHLDLQCLPNSL